MDKFNPSLEKILVLINYPPRNSSNYIKKELINLWIKKSPKIKSSINALSFILISISNHKQIDYQLKNINNKMLIQEKAMIL